MIAIRTAGVVVAAGLIVGCQTKREQPRAKAPEPPSMQAAESLKQSLVRANPDARVGIVAATLGRFAAVRDVPAGNVAEGATVQILDTNGSVIGYGLVRAVKNDSIHVLYQGDTVRGPMVGDLVMPTTDAGVPVEEMPAGAPMQPAAETAEPSNLPPRRATTEAPAEAAPAEAQPAPTAGDVAAPKEPAPSLKEEAQPGDFKPSEPDNKAALPPVDGATDAAAPAAKEPSPGDTNGTASDAGKKAPAEPAPAEKAADEKAPAPEAPKEGAEKDAGAADQKAPEAPGLNK